MTPRPSSARDAALAVVLEHTHDALSALLAARATAALLDARVGGAAPDVDADLASLAASLARAASLLDSARRAAHADSRPVVTVVDPGAAVARVVDEQRRRFPGVRLHVQHAEPGARVRVCGGEAAILRIVANLVVNACEGDARGRAREVRVRVRDDGALLVRDDGPGFRAHVARDGRLPPPHKTRGSGTGLHVVRGLVHASGGTLSTRNVTPRGAEVEVRLPPA